MSWVDAWSESVNRTRILRHSNRAHCAQEKHMARKAKQEVKQRKGGLSIREAATAMGISEDEMRDRLGRPKAVGSGALSKVSRAKLVERAAEEGISVNTLVERLLSARD